MAFATGLLNDFNKVGAGETLGFNNDPLTFSTFEDGLTIGRFAKLDSGSIDNMDASATPVIAGVVLRRVDNKLESASTYDSSVWPAVDVLRAGFCTVDVKAGDTPSFGEAVLAYNVADADIGKASNASGVATNAEFIEEIDTDVWLIRLK